MAKDREQTPDPQASSTSTNVLLAQILQVTQDSNTTLKALLASSKNLEDSNSKILAASASTASLMQQLVDAIVGGDTHVFTVKVTQLAKEIAAQLKK